jgi:CheY-like chemotaxis protein
MPQGGRLTLRTRGDDHGRASVEVADTGVGMSEEVRARCLEPFFTTKGERGTGLGLAMVYGMLERHNGEIGIESEAGRGTTIRLTFPAAANATAAPTGMYPALRPQESLRILLVDDDPTILKSLQELLERDGHSVTATDGGQAGIDAFLATLKNGEPFSIVVTDLGMPNVDGRTVAAAVKAAAPRIPVVLLTGWGQRLMVQNDVPPFVDRVLSKPPKLNDIRVALAELTG